MKKSITALAALGLSLVALGSLTGCSLASEVQNTAKHEDTKTFDSVADMAKQATESASIAFKPASYLPKDGTDVKVTLKTTAEPGYLLKLSMSNDVVPSACVPSDTKPDPAMSASWFPKITGQVYSCSASGDDGPYDDGRLVAIQDGKFLVWAQKAEATPQPTGR
jgi:hypothetical protein